jgi:predicted nucleotidyltransferase
VSELARLLRSVRDVVDDGPAFALVGGFAVSVRTEPRFTRDVDVAMAVGSDAEAEATTQRFLRHGYRVTAVVEHDTAGRLATARLSDATGGMVDLLFASSGIEPEIVARAERLEVVRGVEVPVATTGDLIALKLLSVSDERPTDAADLRALLSVASPTDLADTAKAVRLITDRGFDRGRDLSAALADLGS